jgi:hypothetical protein
MEVIVPHKLLHEDSSSFCQLEAPLVNYLRLLDFTILDQTWLWFLTVLPHSLVF